MAQPALLGEPEGGAPFSESPVSHPEPVAQTCVPRGIPALFCATERAKRRDGKREHRVERAVLRAEVCGPGLRRSLAPRPSRSAPAPAGPRPAAPRSRTSLLPNPHSACDACPALGSYARHALSAPRAGTGTPSLPAPRQHPPLRHPAPPLPAPPAQQALA
ncbi:uncharacterized protein LOC144579213 [Callithrix jacchus]